MTKLTIMIADDVNTIRLAAAGLLSSFLNNIEIDEAKNGLEALLLSRQKKYDLILMDIRMPVMDGLTATRMILREGTCKEIILMTISSIEEYESQAKEIGARALLHKAELGNSLPPMIHSIVKKLRGTSPVSLALS